MPISKSAKKSLRVSRKKYVHNLDERKRLKKAIKDASEKTINKTISLIDKAAKNNLIHKNKAARLKSRLTKKIGKTPKLPGQKNPSSILGASKETKKPKKTKGKK